jgi:dienelactone hydrolase
MSVAAIAAISVSAVQANLGLGSTGDAAIALLVALGLSICCAGPALALVWRLRRPWIVATAAVGGIIVAASAVLDVLLPTPFTPVYAGSLLSLVAGLGAATGGLFGGSDAGATRRRRRRIHFGAASLTALAVIGWLANAGRTHVFEIPPMVVLEPLASDPGAPGAFEYDEFTYGSGTPQQQGRYAERSDVRSRTVDIGSVVEGFDGWQARLHGLYWGFPLSETPLNALVWQPRGDGPFPVVLILHGQHTDSDKSEKGFAYLGKLLASRGFVAVSVDENFLNGPWISAGQREMPARAWLVMQHLLLLDGWNGTVGSRFHGRLDMQRIALVGHSRGGEAATFAAQFPERALHASENAPASARVPRPSAVVALAPTSQLMPAALRMGTPGPTSYLVLQGAHDADVTPFMGAGKYNRMQIPAGSGHFKAAVYIAGANHVQFNTQWGADDKNGPLSWVLNRRTQMSAADQQRIAAFFTSAFLEATLHESTGHRAAFRDVRRAAAMLPTARFVSRFDDDRAQLVDTFEEDGDRGTTTIAGGSHVARNMGVWREEALVLRGPYSLPQQNSAVRLGWHVAGPGSTAVFEIRIPESMSHPGAAASLVLAVGNASIEARADVTIELASGNGEAAALPLSRFGSLEAAIDDPVYKSTVLDRLLVRGAEQVLQSFEIPLAEFVHVNPDFDAADVAIVRLRFDITPAGEILLDDLGFRAAAPGPHLPPPYRRSLRHRTRAPSAQRARSIRPKKSPAASYVASRFVWRRKECTSSGKTSCSTCTPRARSASTSATVSMKETLRSSSPWMTSTGERQPSSVAIGEERKASEEASGSSSGLYDGMKVRIPTFQSCTPWMSTPAAKRSLARESPIAVR